MNSVTTSYIAGIYQANSTNQVGGTQSSGGVSTPAHQRNSSSQSTPFFTNDKVSLSPSARGSANQPTGESVGSTQNKSNSGDQLYKPGSQEKSSTGEELNLEQLRQLEKMKMRDTEVRQHEHTHLAVAGQYAAGGASFTYEKGPDGRNYAVAGEVPIDVSKESSPEATILKMQTIKRAALAPASPSSADRAIAAQADAKAAQARKELQQEQLKEAQNLIASEIEKPSEPTSPTLIVNEGSNQPGLSESVDGISRKTFQMISAYTSVSSLA